MEFHALRYQRIMLDPEVGLWEATAVNLAEFLLTHPIRSLCKGIHPTVPIPTKALWIHHQYILNTQMVVPDHHHKIRFVPVLPVVPAAIKTILVEDTNDLIPMEVDRRLPMDLLILLPCPNNIQLEVLVVVAVTMAISLLVENS